MLCQKCKKNNAVYFYSENINGKKYSVALCEDCKAKYDPSHENASAKNMYDFFESLMFPSSVFQNQFPGMYISEEKHCPACNARFSELASGERSFCPECYNTFNDELSNLLNNIHGATDHSGKRPRRLAKIKEHISEEKKKVEENIAERAERAEEKNALKELKKQLKAAIEEERYEDAAKLRDRIKKEEEK